MTKGTAVTAAIAFVAAIGLAGSPRAAEPDLSQILEIAYKSKGPETMQASMTMTLVDKNGNATERALEIRRAGTNRQIVWFESPPNMRGTGFLRLVEDGTEKMWLYLPAFKKLERIGAADEKRSFLGSDFAYADMGEHDLSKYNASFVEKTSLDGVDVYKLELNIKQMTEAVLYSKIISYVRASDSRVVREDLYDKKGRFVKQKTHPEIETIDGYVIPTSIVMTDVQRDHKTRLDLSDIKLNDKIPDRVFSTRYLQKLK